MQARKLATRFEATVSARQIPEAELKTPPLSQSAPLLEPASMEESEEVQDLWAMDMRSGVSIKKAYIAILKEIGLADATLLDVLFRFGPERTVKLEAAAAPRAVDD